MTKTTTMKPNENAKYDVESKCCAKKILWFEFENYRSNQNRRSKSPGTTKPPGEIRQHIKFVFSPFNNQNRIEIYSTVDFVKL
jgi:hypothetical protein